MKRFNKRVLTLLLVIVMLLGALPIQVFAQQNQVYVIVENQTFTENDGFWEDEFWSGVLVEKWIDIDEDSTMMSAIVEALESEGYEQTGAENNYISSINGLGEFDGGFMSGWMGTLNGWFTNAGFGDFKVANGRLKPGDEIHVMYTTSYGDDIGGGFGSVGMSDDKRLKDIEFSSGELDKEFDSDIKEYSLTLPEGIESIKVIPNPINKNFMHKTTLGAIESEGGTVYQRRAEIPVESGDVIFVEIGNRDWPGMAGHGNASEPEIYRFKIVENEETTSVDKTALEKAIKEAAAAKVQTSEDGKDIPKEEKWTTEEVLIKFENAIEKAEGVKVKADATQEEVDETVTALNNAKALYEASKKDGLKEMIEPEEPDTPDTPDIPEKPEREEHINPKALDFIIFGAGPTSVPEPSQEKENIELRTIELKTKFKIGNEVYIKEIDGLEVENEMDVAAYIKDGRTMIPLRFVGEALGFEVSWNNDDRTAILQKEDIEIKVPVDTNKFYVNGTEYEFDASPEIVEGRTMLSISNLGKALGLSEGKEILWNQEAQEATIITEITE